MKTVLPLAAFLLSGCTVIGSAFVERDLPDGRAVANSLTHVDWWTGWQGIFKWHFGPLIGDDLADFQQSGESFLAPPVLTFAGLMQQIAVVAGALGHPVEPQQLTDLQRRWEQFGFVRVHRQYLANLNNAVELRPELGGTAVLVFKDGQTIPVARRHVAELGRRLSV